MKCSPAVGAAADPAAAAVSTLTKSVRGVSSPADHGATATWVVDYDNNAAAAGQATITDAVGAGAESIPFDAPADAVVVGFVRALLRTGRVPEAAFAAAQALLGQQGTVELTGLVGYYSLLAMQLNTFEVAPPPTVPIPWR